MEPEEDGIVIACASIHGNTKRAMLKFAEILKEKGAENVKFFDLSRDDMAEAIAETYQYSKLVVACPTYDGVLIPVHGRFPVSSENQEFPEQKGSYCGEWFLGTNVRKTDESISGRNEKYHFG